MLCFKSSSRKPLSFLQAGNLVNGDSFRHSRRNLDFFVLLAGIEGSLYISQDDVHCTLGPGEFMLLMPGHVHEGYRSSEGRLSYFWCHFRAGDDYQLVDESGVKQYLESLERSGLPKDIYLLPEHGVFANTNRISLECRQLIDFSMQKPYSNAILDYAASLLALDLTQEYLQQNEKHTVMTRSFCSMIDLQEYIRLHYIIRGAFRSQAGRAVRLPFQLPVHRLQTRYRRIPDSLYQSDADRSGQNAASGHQGFHCRHFLPGGLQ